MEGVAVAQAAVRLGVHPSRVGQLIADGQLRAQRVGGSWLVCSADVARRAAQPPPPGRPLAAGRAWAVLDLLERGDALWLSSVARSQVRQVLRKLEGADERHWQAALRARAEVLSVHAHPAALVRLRAEPAVLLAGPAAAAAAGADLVVLSERSHVYVEPAHWPALAQRYVLNPVAPVDDDAVNLFVHLPRGHWPGGAGGIGPAALAADLLDADEPRARRAGWQMLVSSCARLHKDSSGPASAAQAKRQDRARRPVEAAGT